MIHVHNTVYESIFLSMQQMHRFVVSDNDARMLIDCDSRTREEIHDHIKQVVGKTE